jgi:hypothetical protein
MASPKDSIRLPGEFITWESNTDKNNSTNIRKNSISFLNVPIWTNRSCLKRKLETKNLVTLFLLGKKGDARISAGHKSMAERGYRIQGYV